jgi:hypothetical protein
MTDLGVQPVVVEALIDGEWQNITADVFDRDQPSPAITITRGRPSEIGQTPALRCTSQLDNTDGRYSPRNPLSPLYGKIGRNTPMRVYLGGPPFPGEQRWSTSATVSHVADGVNSPTASAILFCAWGGAIPSSTYTLPGGMTGATAQTNAKATFRAAYEAISASGATGGRTATFGAAGEYVSGTALLHGTSMVVQEAEGDANGLLDTPSGTQPGWWLVMFTSWWWEDTTDVIPDSPFMDNEGGWIKIGDTGTVATTVKTNTYFMRMKVWVKKMHTGGVHQIRIGGPNPLSTMFVVSGVTDWDVRGCFEMSGWPQRSDPTGVVALVPVEAAGIMRRLGAGADPLDSALRRHIPKHDWVKAYWPLEEATRTLVFGSGLDAGRMMRITRRWWGSMQFASQDPPDGSAPLTVFKNGSSAAGSIRSFNPISDVGAGYRWRVDFLFYRAEAPSSGIVMITVDTSSSSAATWQVNVNTTETWVEVFNDAGTSVYSNTDPLPADFWGRWVKVALRVYDHNDGTVTWSVAYTDAATQVLLSSDSGTVSGTRSSRRPVSVSIAVASANERSWGHIAVSHDTSAGRDPYGGASDGWNNEPAYYRFLRLCEEEGISATLVSPNDRPSSVRGEPMGPQRQATLLELLQECADADQGILAETREQLGLVLRGRHSLYNQPSTLTLDYTTGCLAAVPEPVDDDQNVRNDVTAAQPEAATARAVLTEGPLSVQPPPDGIGRYDAQFPVNIAGSDRLNHFAHWLLHLGTVDEPRYLLDLNLIASGTNPSLRAAVAALDVGDRFTLGNMPAWLSPDPLVSLMAQGFIETIDAFRRDIKVNTSPETPWQVATVAAVIGAAGYKADTDGSQLQSGVSDSATTLQVATTRGPIWTAVDAEDGFDIFVAGERMTVTNIDSSTPQNFTVTRSVNGVVKSHAAGTPVRLWQTPIFGL